ncbi:MAG: hypothetical protein ACKOD9_03920, partial [Rubrivivax sp.]
RDQARQALKHHQLRTAGGRMLSMSGVIARHRPEVVSHLVLTYEALFPRGVRGTMPKGLVMQLFGQEAPHAPEPGRRVTDSEFRAAIEQALDALDRVIDEAVTG